MEERGKPADIIELGADGSFEIPDEPAKKELPKFLPSKSSAVIQEIPSRMVMQPSYKLFETFIRDEKGNQIPVFEALVDLLETKKNGKESFDIGVSRNKIQLQVASNQMLQLELPSAVQPKRATCRLQNKQLQIIIPKQE
mmetsp:Transcript_30083/g.39600  ORF Transcript_30083/g.39600 Transcript_30083/m.39600 type:complete len:140 (+) Transcript_30083:108-527(+)|eukprot:CAMPEP_0117738438 /NCGR_PEP_ID=MMETSP0947-20121206/3126_1 /TAXON_ID=44440 /ORGANISM="Chattonella subsalsa, Strain CCMP2191" /LENGTH=139 /DNA_ID=CAMNT_0005554121 /DNA_START=101 /DNA_END=520 /DNA_ORIENTATION=+